MIRDMAGYKSFTHSIPKIPQKKENIRLVRPPMFKGSRCTPRKPCRTPPAAQSCKGYSKPPPMNMLARKIIMSFWLYILESSRVMATAPRPYTGIKGPNTRPTRT